MTVRTIIMTGDLGSLATFTQFVKAAREDILTQHRNDGPAAWSLEAAERGFDASTAIAMQIDTQLGIDGIVFDEETVAGAHLIESVSSALITFASFTHSELLLREDKARNAALAGEEIGGDKPTGAEPADRLPIGAPLIV